MNAPLIWIGLPLVVAAGLWFLKRQRAWPVVIAAALCTLLALLAWALPFGEYIRMGSLTYRVDTTLAIAGRSLVLDQTSRPQLILFYAIAAFWIAGIRAARAQPGMAAYGLGMVAALVAALAVQPLLYAALWIEAAVLISIPLLAQPGRAPGRGVLRYLIFQSLAMPCFILGSWALAGAAANPTDAHMTALTVLFLGLAFAFWLAIFPFYAWVPLLSGEVQPYAGGFVLLILSSAVLLLGLNILATFGWLREAAVLYDVLRLSGGLMVVTAGFWAAFQRSLGRLFGYTVIVQIGFSLLALSLSSRLGDEIFVLMFLPRVIALALWTLAASIYRRHAHALQFDEMERFAERYPFASAGLTIAFLSAAGLPLLAEFPNRDILLQEIAVNHPISALFVLIGSLGLLFSAVRFLTVITGGNLSARLALVRGQEGGETRGQIVLLLGGILLLVVVGLVPHPFFPFMSGLLQVFKNAP